MSLLSLIKGRRGKSGFGFASTAEEVTAGLDLSSRRVVITGVNSGLGLESARVLGRRGARIIGLARTRDKAEAALASVDAAGTAVACELAEPGSVWAAAEEIAAQQEPVDVILCNAGIMGLPRLEQRHGIELQLFTNHVGHYILVTSLLESLAATGRVVMLSSGFHRMTYKGGIQWDNLSGEAGYSPYRAYGQSKLANLLFAKALATRLPERTQTANAVHPGAINTNLNRHMAGWMRALSQPVGALFMKNVHEGAATQCYVAVHPDVATVNGAYFEDCNVCEPSAHGQDPELAERLWHVTEEVVAGLPG